MTAAIRDACDQGTCMVKAKGNVAKVAALLVDDEHGEQ
jgi:hypothetical protein